MLAKRNWLLLGIAVAGILGLQGVGWGLTAHVDLMGDEEGWIEDNLCYWAETWPDLDEDEQQEIENGQGELKYDYDWDFDGGECTTPPADDMSECCKFSWAQGGQYHTISVTVTVTIEWNDGTTTSDVDTDTLDVKVKRPELESVTASKDNICAGHCWSGVHKSTIKATVTDGFGDPAPGWEVTFAITTEDHVETAASLSTTDPVETNYAGEASVVLTSSDKVCSITVQATGEWGQEGSVSIGVGLPSSEPDPTEEVVIALGGGRGLKETLTFGESLVPSHTVAWEITDVQVYESDGSLIENPISDDYGTVDPETDTTDTNGEAETTYSSGSAAGYITIEATDTACYNSSNEHPKLDTFQIIVVRLDHLAVDDAYQVADTNTWATGVSNTEAYVDITAVLMPGVATEDAEDIIGWEGGQAVEGNPLQRQVDKTTTGTTDVAAWVGASSDSVTIKVCEIASLSVSSGAAGFSLEEESHAITAADPDDEDGVILTASLYPEVSPVPEQLLIWSGGESVADHPEQRKVDKTKPTKTELSCACGDSSEEMTVWVVEINLGIAGVPDEDEDEEAGEVTIHSMTSASIEIIPEDVPVGTVTLSHSGGIELWLDAGKETPAPASWDLAEDAEVPTVIYVEGLVVSQEAGQESITLQYAYSPIELKDEVSVTVLPIYGDCEATNGIYGQLPDGGPTPPPPIGRGGGRIWIVPWIRIGPGHRLDEDMNEIEVGVQPVPPSNACPPGYLPWEGKTWPVSLTSAEGWQQWDHEQGQWVNATEPPKTSNVGGTDDKVFRYPVAWDTTTEPLGANGIHTITIEPAVTFQKFEDQQWQDPFESQRAALNMDVRNVVIKNVATSNGTVDYFKYDPEGDASLQRPQFNFTIEDQGDPHEYEWTVYMRQSIPPGWSKSDWETDGQVAYLTGQVTEPGSVQAEWDGAQTPEGEPDEMPAGIYTFDIFVKEYDDVDAEDRQLLDQIEFKTPYATQVSELDSWIAVDEGGQAQLRIKYQFTDEYDRSEVGDAHAVVIGPEMDELAVVALPTATGVLHGGEDNDGDGEADGIPVYDIQPGDPGGEYRIVLVSAQYCILPIPGAARGAEPPRDPPGGPDAVVALYSANYGSDCEDSACCPERGRLLSCRLALEQAIPSR